MAYPSQPVLQVLPQFQGTATVRQSAQQRAQQRAQLLRFVANEYPAGRSLRQLAQLTGRSTTAIRRALDQAGVPRRGPGAHPLTPYSTKRQPSPGPPRQKPHPGRPKGPESRVATGHRAATRSALDAGTGDPIMVGLREEPPTPALDVEDVAGIVAERLLVAREAEHNI